jgi:hypothetical protein
MIPSFEQSPQRYLRIAGLIYLAIIALGLFGELYVRGMLVVPGNPTATANNILAAPLLWRAGIVGDLLMQVCDIPVIVIFYLLLRPVSHNLALMGTFVNLMQTAVLIANKLNLVVPLLMLRDTSYLANLSIAQRETLSYLAIQAHGYGFGIGLIFFGFACLIKGYLIAQSGFLPKALGLLFMLAGASYLINSFALLLAPSIATLLFPAILIPAFVGELTVCIWLIVKGVDMHEWKKRIAK